MIALRILIVVALQTLALAYMIYDRQAMLNAARTVTLKVVPVDPRDIFRGDYVILSYDISRLDLSAIDGDNTFEYNDTVFVTLVPNGATWKVVAIAREKPVAVQGGVAVRGTVNSFDLINPPTAAIGPGGTPAPTPAPAPPPQSFVSVTYGIESYFVPEGTGRAIEDEARKGELSVDAAIDPTGRAAIKALRRGGNVFHVEGVF
jgi:uncharacterized membrane-anchored protein